MARPYRSVVPCPECGRRKTRNRSTYRTPEGTVRYVTCMACGHKFKTLKPPGEQENPIPLRPYNSGRAKLTPDEVREVRQMLAQGVSQMECALAFDVSQTSICRLAQGKTWTHVK